MGIPKPLRLRTRKEFTRIYNSDKKYAGLFIIVRAFVRADGTPAKLGITVSRKVAGKAHSRNLIKRRIRAVFMSVADKLAHNYDIVVIARKQCCDASFKMLNNEMLNALHSIGALDNAHSGSDVNTAD